MMTTSLILSQNINKDSVTVSKSIFKLIMKDVQKFEVLKIAYAEKEVVLNDLIDLNLKAVDEFNAERLMKNEAIDRKIKLEKEINKLNQKRFSIGITVGPAVLADFKIQPAITLGLNYSIFRF